MTMGTMFFSPLNAEPPASNYATRDWRNQHPVLDFDATTDEEAVWSFILPRAYASGGLTVKVHYSMSSAATNNVVFQGAFERIGDEVQDVDADGFASFQSSGQDAVPANLGDVGVATITFTDGAQIDSIAIGELCRFKLRRDADDTSATDNATGDAEVHMVEIYET